LTTKKTVRVPNVKEIRSVKELRERITLFSVYSMELDFGGAVAGPSLSQIANAQQNATSGEQNRK